MIFKILKNFILFNVVYVDRVNLSYYFFFFQILIGYKKGLVVLWNYERCSV